MKLNHPVDAFTPWFDFNKCKPFYRGVYIIENLWGDTYYSYWSGFGWSSGYDSPEEAYMNQTMTTQSPRLKWRGLRVKPL